MEIINIDLVKMLIKKQFPKWDDLEIKAVSNMDMIIELFI